eukprot:COSAG05_NODE_33_length_28089_cov_31.909289_7_plen_221_part_00
MRPKTRSKRQAKGIMGKIKISRAHLPPGARKPLDLASLSPECPGACRFSSVAPLDCNRSPQPAKSAHDVPAHHPRRSAPLPSLRLLTVKTTISSGHSGAPLGASWRPQQPSKRIHRSMARRRTVALPFAASGTRLKSPSSFPATTVLVATNSRACLRIPQAISRRFPHTEPRPGRAGRLPGKRGTRYLIPHRHDRARPPSPSYRDRDSLKRPRQFICRCV